MTCLVEYEGSEGEWGVQTKEKRRSRSQRRRDNKWSKAEAKRTVAIGRISRIMQQSTQQSNYLRKMEKPVNTKVTPDNARTTFPVHFMGVHTKHMHDMHRRSTVLLSLADRPFGHILAL